MRSIVAIFLAIFLCLMSPSARADLDCWRYNLFKNDFAGELLPKIKWDPLARTIDFREIGDAWEEVCLSSLSEYGWAVIDTGNLPPTKNVIGKWACVSGVETGEELVALVYNASGNVVHVPLSNLPGIDGVPVTADYRRSRPPAEARQCASISRAIARCFPEDRPDDAASCHFLFESETQQ